jgi:hypothetical protein
MADASEFQLVNVFARREGGDVPVKQIWVAATPRDQAAAAVRAAIPSGWTAELSNEVLTPAQTAGLKLAPGGVAEIGTAFRLSQEGA